MPRLIPWLHFTFYVFKNHFYTRIHFQNIHYVEDIFSKKHHTKPSPFLILPFYWKLIKTFALKKLRLDILILLFIFRNQRKDFLGIMRHDIKVQALRNVCYVTIAPDLFQTLVWIQLRCNNYVGNLTNNWHKCSLLEEHHHNW